MACSKGLKICCGITAIVIILLLVTLVVLFFTVFKTKQPTITLLPATLEKIQLVVFPVIELNVSLGVLATVKNPNYGSFSYGDSTTSVFYRGNEVAEGPIHGDTIPSHGEVNVSTTLDVTADKFAKDPNFFNDVKSGVVNLTSSTTLHGKVKILSLFKVKATTFSTCGISVFIQNRSVGSTCESKIKI